MCTEVGEWAEGPGSRLQTLSRVTLAVSPVGVLFSDVILVYVYNGHPIINVSSHLLF